jgi:hypothetical protein
MNISPNLISLQKETLLNGVSTATTGSPHPVERAKGWTYSIEATGSASVTVDIEAYVGASWYSIHQEIISGAGSFMIRDDEGHYEKLRAKTTSHSAGTVTVYATGTTNSL